MAGSFKIKLSSAMKPYVGRVVRNGKIQQAFRDAPWRQSLSACVSSATKGKKGQISGGEIKKVVRDCASQHATNVQIQGFPGTGQKGKRGKSSSYISG